VVILGSILYRASVSFQFTNFFIGIDSNVLASACFIVSQVGTYRVDVLNIAAGSCTLFITNIGATAGEAVPIQFSVFNGSQT